MHSVITKVTFAIIYAALIVFFSELSANSAFLVSLLEAHYVQISKSMQGISQIIPSYCVFVFSHVIFVDLTAQKTALRGKKLFFTVRRNFPLKPKFWNFFSPTTCNT